MEEAISSCVSMLWVNGASLKEIRSLTFRQAYRLSMDIVQRKKNEAYNFGVVSRVAFWAEGRDFKEALDSLREDDGR